MLTACLLCADYVLRCVLSACWLLAGPPLSDLPRPPDLHLSPHQLLSMPISPSPRPTHAPSHTTSTPAPQALTAVCSCLQLGDNGPVGRIDGTFGKTKFKCVFSDSAGGVEGLQEACHKSRLLLRFKRFVFDPNKRMIQSDI